MNRRDLLKAAAAVPPALAMPAAFAQDEPKRGIVGSMAPELDVDFWLGPDGESASFSMDAQRGKWVYMKLWQSWCPGCHSLGFPALQKVTEAFIDEDRVVTLGVQTVFEGHGVNTDDKVREMQLRYDLPIMMGHDPGNKTATGYPNTMISYRTGGTPWQVIIAPDGRVVFDGFRVDAEQVISTIREDLAKSS